MSFGVSIGDGLLLTQLAWRTYQGAKEACGEHDELTREVLSLHKVLQRVLDDTADPESPLNRADDGRRKELEEHVASCEPVLKVMNSILAKFNSLADNKRTGKKLWQQVKFANGETKDLADIRTKLSVHTSAILMSLNLCSLGSLGRVESQLGQLPGIRESINWIAANMTAGNKDATVWTSHAGDDKDFWRQLRRELVKEGYPSSSLHKHKRLIKAYVKELGGRGVFDEQVDEEPEIEIGRSISLLLTECGSPEGDIKSSKSVTVDEVLDADFIPGSHPNVEETFLQHRRPASTPPPPPKHHYIFNPKEPCTDLIHIPAPEDANPPSVIFWFRFGIEGKARQADVSTDLFFDNCRRSDFTDAPMLLDYTTSEHKSFTFDKVVWAEDEEYATALWEALLVYINFLNTGKYDNSQVGATHIDAYLFSELFASPRFAEVIMKEILAGLPSSKYDGNMVEILDYVYKHTSSDSILRKVYFDTADFWYSPKSWDKFWKGGGTFAGAHALPVRIVAAHERETCTCGWSKRTLGKDESKWIEESENHMGSGRALEDYAYVDLSWSNFYGRRVKTYYPRSHVYCRCQTAPWLDDPGRYFAPLPKTLRQPQIAWWKF